MWKAWMLGYVESLDMWKAWICGKHGRLDIWQCLYPVNVTYIRQC